MRTLRPARPRGPAGRETGAVASIVLLAFMVMAVPIAMGSLATASQLSTNSRVYDKRVTTEYETISGAEVGIWQATSDPDYDVGLTPTDPSKTSTVSSNGETVSVTVTKKFGGDALRGQGLGISKTVSPQTAPVGTLTNFTYEITIQNEGTGAAIIQRVKDYLPPHLSYVTGTTFGLTNSDPAADNSSGPTSCGTVPYTLEWVLSPAVSLGVGGKVTLVFDAQGTLPTGGYYNQAQISYQPWWDTATVEIYTPYTAEGVVGAGNPKCGYHADVLLTKSVSPALAELGVETAFTYTITVENASLSTYELQQVEDLLPPGFTYVDSSTAGITTDNPTKALDVTLQRWRLTWGDAAAAVPLTVLSPGQTKTLVFEAKGTMETGVSYINEVSGIYETPDPEFGAEAYADIVLVFDNSISVSPSELPDLKNAANTIVDRFKLDETGDHIRIGATRFAGSSAPLVDMTDVDVHGANEPLHNGINSLSWIGGLFLGFGTNILDGLNGGAAQFGSGLGDRPGVPNLMIMITDGNDNAGNTIQDIEAASAASGAEIFAVGVGSEISTSTLDAIASDPDSDHVFFTADFSGLLALVDEIVAAALAAAKQVVTVQGGAGEAAVATGGTLYDVESTAPDGSSVQSRVLVKPNSDVEILSWKKE